MSAARYEVRDSESKSAEGAGGDGSAASTVATGRHRVRADRRKRRKHRKHKRERRGQQRGFGVKGQRATWGGGGVSVLTREPSFMKPKEPMLDLTLPPEWKFPNDVGLPDAPREQEHAPAPWAESEEHGKRDPSTDGTYVSRMYSTRGLHLVNTPFRATGATQVSVRPDVNDIAAEVRAETLDGEMGDWRMRGCANGFITDEMLDRMRLQVRRSFATGFCSMPAMHLTEIPMPILNTLSLQMHMLRELHIADNKLAHIPTPTWMALSSLESLTLRNNRLTALDESMRLMTRLTDLDVSVNRLQDLPRSVVHLQNLKLLSVEYNRLRFFPNPVHLPNIETIRAANNYLEILPDGLEQSPHLGRLDVSRNSIVSLLILPAVEPPKDSEDAVLRPWEWEESKDAITKMPIWFHKATGKTTRVDPHRAGIKRRLLRKLATEHAMRVLEDDAPGDGNDKRQRRPSTSGTTVYSMTGGLGVGSVGRGGSVHTGRVGLASRSSDRSSVRRPGTAPAPDASSDAQHLIATGVDLGSIAESKTPTVPSLNMGKLHAYEAKRSRAQQMSEAKAEVDKQADAIVEAEALLEGRHPDDVIGDSKGSEDIPTEAPLVTSSEAKNGVSAEPESAIDGPMVQFDSALDSVASSMRIELKRVHRTSRDEYWSKVDAQIAQLGGVDAALDDDLAEDLWTRYVLVALAEIGRPRWQINQDPKTGQLLFRDNVTDTVTTDAPGDVDRLDGMHSLTHLNLSNNKLVALPDGLARLTALRHLNLDYNKVSEQSFPDTFDRLNLEWLSVRYNGCDPIPTNLPKITTLETLRLDGNGIKVLPEEIGQLHRLKTLHLSQNDLHDLPEGLSGCTSLTEIKLGLNAHLDHSWIDTVVQGVDHLLWRCRQMVNKTLRGAPPFMPIVAMGAGREARVAKAEADEWMDAAMKEALLTKRVKVHWKSIKYLPEGAYQVIDLREISLIGNAMVHAPFDLNYFSSLTRLQLRSNKIVDFPDDAFATMTALTDLSLEDNRLKELPSSITMATALRELHLDNNRVRRLPDDLGIHLQKMRSITMNFNKLEELPPSIGNMAKLKQLWVNHNRLTDLPVSMSFNKSLTSFRLDSNRIAELPRILTHIPLEELTVASNRLVELPRYMTVAPVLKTTLKKLWLQNNRITEVNATLFQLESLEMFSVDVNPLRSPPTEVSAGGMDAVLQYARIRDQHIHDMMEEAVRSQIILREDRMFPIVSEAVSGGIGHLDIDDLDEFDQELDNYVNGMCHQCPLTAADIASALERRRFERAEEVRLIVIQKLRRVLELADRYKWAPKHSFSSKLVRPWGPDKSPVYCFAITADVLFGPDGDNSELSLVHRATTTSSSLFHGLDGPDLTINVVLDALRNFRGPCGHVGYPVDTVDFAMLEHDARDAKQAAEEAAAAAKKGGKVSEDEKKKQLIRNLLHPDEEGVYEMRKSNAKPAIVVQRVNWTEEDVEHYNEEKSMMKDVTQDIKEDLELLFKTKEGLTIVKQRIKADRKAIKSQYKEASAKYHAARKIMTKSNKEAMKIVIKRQAYFRDEPGARKHWDSVDDMEDDFDRVLEDLQFAEEDYKQAKADREPIEKLHTMKKVPFRKRVESIISEERKQNIVDKFIDARRLAALKSGATRPWDGVDGTDFDKWKAQCKHEVNEAGARVLVTPLEQRIREDKEREKRERAEAAANAPKKKRRPWG